MPGASPEENAALVVVVDDDAMLARTLAGNLQDSGFRTRVFTDGRLAVDWFTQGGTAAAVLLDWHMPDLDGLGVMRQLRATGSRVPVVFLTGHSQPIYEEAALAGGAVDFVDKAKSFAIILHRLRIVIGGEKQAAAMAAAEPASASTTEGGPGGLKLDTDSARAFWRTEQVDLTLGEFRVVQLLAERAGRDVSYREIYDVVRGEGFLAGSGPEGYRANVRALVKRVRQKFRAVDDGFDALENYPGFGYRWARDAGA